MSTVRQEAIRNITCARHHLNRVDFKKTHVKDLYGINVFNEEVQRSRLPKPAFKALQKTIKQGAPLDPNVADAVASAMKDWAIEKGATHYTHIFQPMTGITAEKHDSFLAPDGNGGGAIAEFSGKELVKGEPDASSFPSGGIRATFEARGYTGWDPTSPAYIRETPNGATLVIPTVFVSWTGEALDKKTPLLRSMEALSVQAMRILKLFKKTDVVKVFTTVGPEQEYFLIDKNFLYARPDLLNCGRTLFGAKPPKGQELEDQYFGTIPERVIACMAECEAEMFKLGIPVKTRHNEVAPSQYEIAPIFEDSNLATDHNQLTMDIMRRTADDYGMVCLLHEKPFAGINGSGKHNNWSMATDTGENLLNPGDDPHGNAQFLVFCTAVIRAVAKYSDLLRLSIASAHNDHRLGANEAPPAIISVFLGDQLNDIFEQLEKGPATSSKRGGMFETGVLVIPPMPKEAGDRNRTSPFAFTGNKFEFRAVGASQNIAGPNMILNAAMADSLEGIANDLEAATAKGEDLNKAVAKLLTKIIKEHKRIIFNGNNYAAEWEKEAGKRKLLNLKNTVDALPQLVTKDAIALLEKFKILNAREVHARYEIFLENYNKTINVEGQLMVLIANRYILPAALEYQRNTGQSVAAVKAGGGSSVQGKKLLAQYTKLVDRFKTQTDALAAALEHGNGSAEKHAKYMRDKVVPAMEKLRATGDEIEVLTPHEIWPLPTYREMLFVK